LEETLNSSERRAPERMDGPLVAPPEDGRGNVNKKLAPIFVLVD